MVQCCRFPHPHPIPQRAKLHHFPLTGELLFESWGGSLPIYRPRPLHYIILVCPLPVFPFSRCLFPPPATSLFLTFEASDFDSTWHFMANAPADASCDLYSHPLQTRMCLFQRLPLPGCPCSPLSPQGLHITLFWVLFNSLFIFDGIDTILCVPCPRYTARTELPPTCSLHYSAAPRPFHSLQSVYCNSIFASTLSQPLFPRGTVRFQAFLQPSHPASSGFSCRARPLEFESWGGVPPSVPLSPSLHHYLPFCRVLREAGFSQPSLQPPATDSRPL